MILKIDENVYSKLLKFAYDGAAERSVGFQLVDPLHEKMRQMNPEYDAKLKKLEKEKKRLRKEESFNFAQSNINKKFWLYGDPLSQIKVIGWEEQSEPFKNRDERAFTYLDYGVKVECLGIIYYPQVGQVLKHSNYETLKGMIKVVDHKDLLPD